MLGNFKLTFTNYSCNKFILKKPPFCLLKASNKLYKQRLSRNLCPVITNGLGQGQGHDPCFKL